MTTHDKPIRGPENQWDARCPRCGEIANLSQKIDGQRCCEKCAEAREPRTIRDGLVPFGPEDTYNGVKVSSFCMACRDGIARYEHGMQASVTLCAEDSARVVRAMSSVHVVGGGTADDYRTKFGIVEVPPVEDAPTDAAFGAFEVKLPAPAHPPPWRYDELGPNGAGRVVDASGDVVIESSDEYESVEFADGALALVLAAPEMEALLRRLSENFYGDHDEAAKDIEDVDALLARIDAAKAG